MSNSKSAESPTVATVDYCDINGVPLVTLETTPDKAEDLLNSMRVLWPLMTKVWSVRVTTSGSKRAVTVLRRPPAVALEPCVAPNPIRTRQQGRRGW